MKIDYPQEQQALVEKMSVTINNGFEIIYNAMSHNVSLTDNIFCTISTVTVTVDSTGTPTSSSSFQIDTTGTLKGTQVINAVNNTKSTIYPTAVPFITYTQNNKLISIVNISGLPANNKFTLTLIAWG